MRTAPANEEYLHRVRDIGLTCDYTGRYGCGGFFQLNDAYIQHHLSEPITAEDIAKELYLSRPYLSRKFIEETGESLTDFILKEKTEEAKRLLRYSDKSLTAIGNYLGFSSQSHFSRVFKKYANCTPGEYRAKYTN